MSIAGLRLPYLTAPDPALAGEGSLDPLGLATLADRLADEIAPGITARMQRARFVTAMAVTSALTEELEDRLASDGVTPPYLAFEWIVVEAFARVSEPAPPRHGVAGIDKAREAVLRKSHLDFRSYLKTPKVFGFHGIYKRLAIALEVVDRDLILTSLGRELVETWESEQNLEGFLETRPETPGGELAQRLRSALMRTLDEGRVAVPPLSSLWAPIVQGLHPDRAGRRERQLLTSALLNRRRECGAELFASVRRHPTAPEWDVLQAVTAGASQEMRIRISAINAFEAVARELTTAFDWIRCCSTAVGGPVTRDTAKRSDQLGASARRLPGMLRKAVEVLRPLDLAVPLELLLGGFADVADGAGLFDELLRHHERVQAAKAPRGKRAWFDAMGAGVVVRAAYRVPRPPEIPPYVHPFRIKAMQEFWRDLA